MKRLFIVTKVIFAIFFLLTTYCSAEGLPDVVNENCSAIAITVNQRASEGLGELLNIGNTTLEVKKVFYIKLKDKNDSLKQDKVFVSNYLYKSFPRLNVEFLFNIEPGWYAVVGAEVKTPPLFIYFPKELIEASVTEVRANSIAYMGEFNLSYNALYGHKDVNNPDILQKYYYLNHLFDINSTDDIGKKRVVSSELARSMFPKTFKMSKSPETERSFITRFLDVEEFDQSPWKIKLKNRLNALSNEPN